MLIPTQKCGRRTRGSQAVFSAQVSGWQELINAGSRVATGGASERCGQAALSLLEEMAAATSLIKGGERAFERSQSPKSFRQPSAQITQFQRLNRNVGSRQNLPIAYD